MDSTNLFQSQQQTNRCAYGWFGHTHRGMHPHKDLSTIRATHNDMLIYHSNKLHVVKVPVVVRDQLLKAIPVAEPVFTKLVLESPKKSVQPVFTRLTLEPLKEAVHYTTESATIGGLTVYPGNYTVSISLMQIIIY
jgi:hypothetical protein